MDFNSQPRQLSKPRESSLFNFYENIQKRCFDIGYRVFGIETKEKSDPPKEAENAAKSELIGKMHSSMRLGRHLTEEQINFLSNDTCTDMPSHFDNLMKSEKTTYWDLKLAKVANRHDSQNETANTLENVKKSCIEALKENNISEEEASAKANEIVEKYGNLRGKKYSEQLALPIISVYYGYITQIGEHPYNRQLFDEHKERLVKISKRFERLVAKLDIPSPSDGLTLAESVLFAYTGKFGSDLLQNKLEIKRIIQQDYQEKYEEIKKIELDNENSEADENTKPDIVQVWKYIKTIPSFIENISRYGKMIGLSPKRIDDLKSWVPKNDESSAKIDELLEDGSFDGEFLKDDSTKEIFREWVAGVNTIFQEIGKECAPLLKDVLQALEASTLQVDTALKSIQGAINYIDREYDLHRLDYIYLQSIQDLFRDPDVDKEIIWRFKANSIDQQVEAWKKTLEENLQDLQKQKDNMKLIFSNYWNPADETHLEATRLSTLPKNSYDYAKNALVNIEKLQRISRILTIFKNKAEKENTYQELSLIEQKIQHITNNVSSSMEQRGDTPLRLEEDVKYFFNDFSEDFLQEAKNFLKQESQEKDEPIKNIKAFIKMAELREYAGNLLPQDYPSERKEQLVDAIDAWIMQEKRYRDVSELTEPVEALFEQAECSPEQINQLTVKIRECVRRKAETLQYNERKTRISLYNRFVDHWKENDKTIQTKLSNFDKQELKEDNPLRKEANQIKRFLEQTGKTLQETRDPRKMANVGDYHFTDLENRTLFAEDRIKQMNRMERPLGEELIQDNWCERPVEYALMSITELNFPESSTEDEKAYLYQNIGYTTYDNVIQPLVKMVESMAKKERSEWSPGEKVLYDTHEFRHAQFFYNYYGQNRKRVETITSVEDPYSLARSCEFELVETLVEEKSINIPNIENFRYSQWREREWTREEATKEVTSIAEACQATLRDGSEYSNLRTSIIHDLIQNVYLLTKVNLELPQVNEELDRIERGESQKNPAEQLQMEKLKKDLVYMQKMTQERLTHFGKIYAWKNLSEMTFFSEKSEKNVLTYIENLRSRYQDIPKDVFDQNKKAILYKCFDSVCWPIRVAPKQQFEKQKKQYQTQIHKELGFLQEKYAKNKIGEYRPEFEDFYIDDVEIMLPDTKGIELLLANFLQSAEIMQKYRQGTSKSGEPDDLG